MKITISPTGQLITINGQVHTRLWEGTTDNGCKVQLLIASVVCTDSPEENARIVRELWDIEPPKYVY
jgi:hypothetical protein